MLPLGRRDDGERVRRGPGDGEDHQVREPQDEPGHGLRHAGHTESVEFPLFFEEVQERSSPAGIGIQDQRASQAAHRPLTTFPIGSSCRHVATVGAAREVD